MKIKRFYESLITSGLENEIPKKLELYTHTGNFNYLLINVLNDGHVIKGVYHKQHKMSDEGLVENESERLTLQFNFHTENGELKILGQILHGGSLKYEYSMLKPNILRLINYDGFGSRMDSDSKFGFDDETVKSLVRFINGFGFKLTIDNFKFLDKYSCSYQHWESLKIEHIFDGTILVLDNGEPNRRNFVLNISHYLRQRGVNHILTSSVAEMKSILQTENIVGVISAGANYRVSNPWGDGEQDLSHTSLKMINKPIIGMCFAYQSMANFYGAKVKDSGKYFMDNIKLTYWDKESPIFQNINLDDCQFSVDFHDIVTECPEGFKVIAKYKDNIFGIENQKMMRWGLAFHPEDIERTFPILDNFLDICREIHNKSRETESIKKFNDFI
jgi:anthranilate/para-aminobenzoate synthase component II